jgi:hypothetical protein
MEKLIYTLWRPANLSAADWRDAILRAAAGALPIAGGRDVQFSLVDENVEAGKGLHLVTRDVPDGVITFWLESANYRQSSETLLRAECQRIAGYLVTESCIKDERPDDKGKRAEGFNLIGFLRRPPRLSREEWLKIWLESHTAVAVETQPTFRYVQNLVARPLTDDTPELDALVEEGFPIEALNNPEHFYDAVGDEKKFSENHERMMVSCRRFIDFDRIDSLPMSRYRL